MEFKEPDEFWWEFSTERLSSYKPGGFHPVHIGDLFSKIQATGRPRYKILAKLGTGSYSTVWLATDMLINRLVALKIIVARLTGHNKEIPILDRLSRCEPGTAGVAHIIRLLDSFQVEGPNGVHEVLVTEVVIGWNELYEAEAAPPVRKVATELALGLKHIHSLQIVHGDLHNGNIGFRIDGFDRIPEAQILEAINKTREQFCGPLVATDHARDLAGLPRYILISKDKTEWMLQFCNREKMTAVILDFGEAFFEDQPPSSPMTPFVLRSPELVLNLCPFGKPSDIWALACTISELVLGWPLFSRMYTPEKLLRKMVATLGPLPETWIAHLKDADIVPDLSADQISDLISGAEEPNAVVDRVAIGWLYSVDERPFSQENLDAGFAFLDLLRAMLRYKCQERATIEEVVQHPWLR